MTKFFGAMGREGERKRAMSQKKIFLLLIAISTVSLLLHHGGHLSWTMEAFHLRCPVLRSHPSPGLKPKHTNVAFLKTHKTASSTVQNLLFRFAERNNLTVALPIQQCGHMFCYPSIFSGRYVHAHTQAPNVLASHMRFSSAELRRLMPNDTVYVTIVRELTSMFESQFSYFQQHCQSFKRVPNGSLEAFLAEPWRYYRPAETDSMFARNMLTFDLGGDKDQPEVDEDYPRTFVAEVERFFSLVMIAEHFDESLVLLRHLLSWDLEDVLYLKLNMRSQGSKRELTPALAAKIRGWNHLDARLYDHFNASLWRQLEALGTACVAREVRLLRRAQERLTRGCFGGRVPPLRSATQIKNKELRPWKPSAKVDIVGYDQPVNLSREATAAGLTHEQCLRLIMPELQYTSVLLNSQSLRYRRNHPFRAAMRPLVPQQAPLRAVLPRQRQVGMRSVHVRPPPAPGPGSGPVQGSTDSPQPAGGSKGEADRAGLRASQTQAPNSP